MKKINESQTIMVLITISGGLQDAYSYLLRNHVFANAQTGNIVLLTGHLVHREWMEALHYLIPLLAFASGILVAEQMHGYLKDRTRLHWTQYVLLTESLCLFLSGFLPQNYFTLANALVSFACAMQVESFRSVNGCGYASTMCIGNLRGAMTSLSKWIRTKDTASYQHFKQYRNIIFCFAIGAALGSILAPILTLKTIWLSTLLLSGAFGVMFYDLR